MGNHILMVLALIGAIVIPIVFGASPGSMIASHLCILTVTLAIFFGVIFMKKGDGPK